MGVSIGPQIGVDGYAQYKADIKQIIAQIEQYKAKTEALSDSAEDLKQKEEYLRKEIELQSKVMKKLEEYQGKVAEKTTELENAEKKNEKQIQRSRIAYTDVSTEIIKQQTELDKLGRALENVEQKQHEETDVLEEMADAGSKTQNAISASAVALGNLMAKVVEKGAELVKQAYEVGINYNASMETYNAAFSTLLGSEDAAREAVDNVRKLSKETPTFSTSSLTKSVQMLVAADKSAEQATEDVRALANAIAASGGGNSELERMAQNLQQIANAGKATSIDIRQFAYAGINVSQLLADYTGKSLEEVKGMTVTYEMLTGALRYAASEGGRYYGGLEKQAETYNGQLSAMKKNAEELAGEFASSLTGLAEEEIFPWLNEFLSSDKTKQFASDLGRVGPAGVLAGAGLIAVDKAAMLLGVSFGSVLGPLAAVLAGITAITVAFKAQKSTWDNATLGEGHTLEEYEANVKHYADEVERLKGEYDELADCGADLTMVSSELSNAQIALGRAQKELAEASKEAGEAIEDAAEAESKAVPAARVDSIILNAKEQLDALKESYDAYYEAAEKAAQKTFDLFEEYEASKPEDLLSVDTLTANLASQTAFWEKYAENIAYVSDATTGLSKELLAYLSDGSVESAEYLQGIINEIMAAGGATSEEGQAVIDNINQAFADLQQAQNNYAATTAQTMTDYKKSMEDIVEDAKSKLQELDLEDEMFEEGVNSITGYANGLAKEMPGLEADMFLWGQNLSIQLQNGINSVSVSMPNINGVATTNGATISGIPGFAGGLDNVPEDDFLAYLHKGEMVLTAAQASMIRSGEYQQSIANAAYNYGGVSINVYAAEGQSVDEIADTVAFKLQNAVDQKDGVFR